MQNNYNLNKEQVFDLYLNQRLSFEKIGKLLGCSGSTVNRFYKKNGGIVRTNAEQATKYFFNEKYFDTINSESAYWLGFLYADGYLTKDNIIGIKLKKDDCAHLQSFLNAIHSNHPINYYVSQNEFGTCEYGTISLHSDYMFNKLQSLGVVKNKSLILTFPTKQTIPETCVWDFIRGYFDGDGSIYYRQNNPNLKTINIVGTLEFLTELNKLINNEGNIYKEKRSANNTYSLIINKQNIILELKNRMYHNEGDPYLQRKKERF